MYKSGGFLVIAIFGNKRQRQNHESGGFMLQGMQQLFVIASVKVIWHNGGLTGFLGRLKIMVA